MKSNLISRRKDVLSTDRNQVLHEILEMTSVAKRMLENLILQYDETDEDVSELDVAADALSDAAEILEDILEI